MNARDLATKLAEKENLTRRDAEAAIKLIFRLFTDALKKGGRIEIRGCVFQFIRPDLSVLSFVRLFAHTRTSGT
jgi:hypothetical protein